MSQVTVIVNVYNEEKNLRQFLDMLCSQTFQGFKVLLADDGSTDNSLSIAEAYRDSLDLEILRWSHRGLRAARAAATELVETPIFIILDADLILEPMCIEQFVAEFTDPTVAAVGSKYVSTGEGWIIRGSRIMQLLYSGLTRSSASGAKETTHVRGGMSAYRTDAIRRVGGFPEGEIPEDLIISWKLRQAGYRLLTKGDLVIYHKDPDTIIGILRWGYKYGKLNFHMLRKYKTRIFQWYYALMWGPLVVIALALLQWKAAVLALLISLPSFLWITRRIPYPVWDKFLGWIIFLVRLAGWDAGFLVEGAKYVFNISRPRQVH